MAMLPLNDHYFIFNFFEPTPDTEEFFNKWSIAADYVKNKDHFVSSFLHSSSDAKSAYPVVNFAVFGSDDVCVFGKPDDEWFKLTRGAAANKFVGYPAGYREVASYSGKKSQAEENKSTGEKRYFITAVKVAETVSDENFEANWKKWSNCDVIHDKLGGSVVGSGLYKRFTSKMAPLFKYVVRTEVKDVSDEEGHVIAKAANESPSSAGISTITAFYKVHIAIE